MDELEMYKTDRPRWLREYGGPNMAAHICGSTYGDDDALLAAWEGMGDGSGKASDYQAAVWALLPEPQRQRIRTLRSGK